MIILYFNCHGIWENGCDLSRSPTGTEYPMCVVFLLMKIDSGFFYTAECITLPLDEFSDLDCLNNLIKV